MEDAGFGAEAARPIFTIGPLIVTPPDQSNKTGTDFEANLGQAFNDDFHIQL
jgi:hypothetical protein